MCVLLLLLLIVPTEKSEIAILRRSLSAPAAARYSDGHSVLFLRVFATTTEAGELMRPVKCLSYLSVQNNTNLAEIGAVS